MRRADFHITVFGRMEVQQKLDQCPLQPCTHVGKTDEASPADFYCATQIEEAKLCSQVDMIQRLKIKNRLLTPDTDFGIRLGIDADWSVRMGQVRYAKQKFGLELLGRRGRLAQSGNFFTDTSNFG